jgi:hypothetical protein
VSAPHLEEFAKRKMPRGADPTVSCRCHEAQHACESRQLRAMPYWSAASSYPQHGLGTKRCRSRTGGSELASRSAGALTLRELLGLAYPVLLLLRHRTYALLRDCTPALLWGLVLCVGLTLGIYEVSSPLALPRSGMSRRSDAPRDRVAGAVDRWDGVPGPVHLRHHQRMPVIPFCGGCYEDSFTSLAVMTVVSAISVFVLSRAESAIRERNDVDTVLGFY